MGAQSWYGVRDQTALWDFSHYCLAKFKKKKNAPSVASLLTLGGKMSLAKKPKSAETPVVGHKTSSPVPNTTEGQGS